MTTGGAAATKLPHEGDVLGGKYSVVRVVGEGGMGVVYEARHTKLGQRVAIKLLREAERLVPEFVHRFEREARAAAKLKSPNVTRVYDVDQLDDGTPFMVMEFLDGVDLDTELEQRGRLPPDEAVGYLLQACSAVAEAHALGIVHRDLKPHNLFLTGPREARQVKLLDFGISKIHDESETSVTLTRSSLGTPLYMSPEQIRSARKADTRSDVWSLGVILYELITGRAPFDGDGPSGVIAAITADDPMPPDALCPGLSSELSAAILKALEKRPSRRYQSVTELAEALRPFGPFGAWVPPTGVSNPSNARISIPDFDGSLVRAEALTVAAPGNEQESAARAARSSRSRSGIAIAALALAALVATAVFVATRPKAEAVEPAARDTAPVPLRELVPEPHVTQRAVPDEPSVEPAVPASATNEAEPPPRVPPKPRTGSKITAPAPAKPEGTAEPPPPTPPPPEPPSENPLHL